MNGLATIPDVILLELGCRNVRPRIVPPADLDEADAQMAESPRLPLGTGASASNEARSRRLAISLVPRR